MYLGLAITGDPSGVSVSEEVSHEVVVQQRRTLRLQKACNERVPRWGGGVGKHDKPACVSKE